VSINLAPQGPARRFGRELLSGDACFGPPWASNIPNGLTADTSAQLPWLGKLSHRWIFSFLNSGLSAVNIFVFLAFLSNYSI
jgi:hypothetical protein